jgi:hypothetical protein
LAVPDRVGPKSRHRDVRVVVAAFHLIHPEADHLKATLSGHPANVRLPSKAASASGPFMQPFFWNFSPLSCKKTVMEWREA